MERGAEPVTLTFSLRSVGREGGELRATPLVCAPDLIAKVVQLLEQNTERLGLYTGFLPRGANLENVKKGGGRGCS